MDREEKTVLSVLGALTTTLSTAGSVTIAVTTTKVLGITVATTTVALPVVSVAVVGGALTYGGYKVWRMLRKQKDTEPPGPTIESSPTDPPVEPNGGAAHRAEPQNLAP